MNSGDKMRNLMDDMLTESTMYSSPSAFGGTKDAEYRRTIELFEETFKEKGTYYALALLYDSQYDREDILKMMEILKPGKGRLTDMM